MQTTKNNNVFKWTTGFLLAAILISAWPVSDTITNEHLYKQRLADNDSRHIQTVHSVREQFLYAAQKVKDSDNVFIGTEVTERFCIALFANNNNVKNFGLSTALASEQRDLLRLIIQKHPKQVFIECGLADILYGNHDAKEYEATIKEIVEVAASSPYTRLFLLYTLPINNYQDASKTEEANANIRAFNEVLHKFSQLQNVQVLNTYNQFVKNDAISPDVTCDGIIPTSTTYFKLYQELQPFL